MLLEFVRASSARLGFLARGALAILRLVASANMELVRSIYAAWERGDFSAAPWAHRAIEYVVADGPAPGSWTGADGMARAWRDVLSAWEDYRPEVEEYRELDAERVLVLLRFRGRGKISGLELGQMEAKGAHLVQVRDGKVTKSVLYFDRDRALADLGFALDAGSAGS